MLSFDYNGYGDLSAVTYANGWREEYAYSGRTLQSVTLKEGNIQNTVISYGYTGNELTSITQGNGYAAQLTYGFAESKTESESTVSGEVNASYRYEYGEKSGNLKSIESTLGDSSHTRTETLEYAEGEYGELTSWGDDWLAVLYGYDGIGRLSTRKVRVGNTERQQLRYEYADRVEGEETYLSGRIGKITNETTNAYQTYSYDSKGYVRRYYNSGSGEEYNYTYDGLGRLTTDGVKEYTYDHLNNVTRIESGGNLTELYGYAMRPTQLANTVENGSMKYYRYDEQGNMTLYKGESFSDTDNLYWTRGNLLSYGSIGGYFNYRYGPDNLRYYKLAQGKITKYYWSGNTLMGESTGESYTQYIYDATGIAGMICDGSYYYFEKNLFGDVVKAYDANGTEVAAFRYDAYGNILYESGSMAEKVKIRYRGYYYDAETGFYYLQSRYYAPSICRFISSDQYELIPTLSQIPGQLNLYAYCNNNPVMFTDESGCSPLPWWEELLIGLGFIIIGAAVTALTAGTGLGFMAAFGSALLTSVKAVAISTAISASIGLIMGGLTTGTWNGALNGMLEGAVDGFMWGGIFAGGAQILSAGFQGLAKLGVATGRAGGIAKTGILSPDKLRTPASISKIASRGQKFYDYGGTILKFGKYAHIDVSTKSLLHLHLWVAQAHLPLGTIGAGIIGGF